jgi:hypothetical protein
VSRTLSTYLKQWAGQATDTCAATHVRAEQSREVMALRMACLHERLSTARALTETLTRADAKVVSHALDAALGLPDLDRCSELVLLRAAVKPPEGAARQAEVERLRRRMADVKLMTRTGHFEAVASEIEKLERDIRAADYPPLLVDFLLFVGSDVGNLGVPTKTASSAREALMVAEGAGYEEGIAEALTAITVTEYRNAAFADLAYDQADAILRHLGDPLVLRAWLENNASLTAYARGRIGKALGHATRALALKERRTPRDARDIAIGESNICWLLDLRGQPRDALPHCDRAVQLINEELGSTHPQAVNLAENRASVLTRLGRFAEGCSVATYVRAFFEGRGERIDQRTTLLLTLGRCAVNDGDPAAGVRHVERALAEANRSGATPAEIGEIEWQLGSIVDAAGDHRRGVDVADRALKRYASLPEFAERQHQIRAWLAARRTRDR